MKFISGLFLGMIFGFLLKRGRFCPTGLLRDIYMEKNYYNIVIMLALIFTQGFIYSLFVGQNMITKDYLMPFSLLGVGFGAFIFGFGAVMTNGCLTSSLLKSGDGRIIGILSVIVFMISGYIATVGKLVPITKYFESITMIRDRILWNLPISPLMISIIGIAITYIIMYKHHKKYKPKYKLPQQYTGIRHICFEKIWSKEAMAISLGIFMGLTFLISETSCGRSAGVAISSPVLSWIYLLMNKEAIAGGGCNPYDLNFGWGSLFVLGIVLGSFITAWLSQEFSIVKTNKKVIIMTIIGSTLMGFGAVWGQGCIVGNSLVGTARFSLKSWYAVMFLCIGIWTSTKIFLLKDLKNY